MYFKWIVGVFGSLLVTFSATYPVLASNFGWGQDGHGGALGAPELSATAAGGAIALLAGGWMLLAERRKRQQA